MARGRTVVPVRIPTGTSLSQEINIDSLTIVGIIMPPAWDAAGIAFQALVAEPSALPKVPVYGNVVDQAAAAINITGVTAGVYVAISRQVAQSLTALGRMLVRSGTNAVPVNQTAQRDFYLVCVEG